ncbi:hypothetical protein F3Y22_tig00117034pilonHSYRG01837 [Hibiscus syriacus]|uniref:Histone-lysine N-methyltransferase, H3 lysine-9 specific SUVH6 n=1 Tax=Hibiscus syriacus TaxID=106335 RepID=A0A6A2X040_HIBSY|nr:histone-lysine N-methyltransferase, H3 lysine-9 specific SUVH5-like [Hibiscus syriacus]KAE8655276.1 hypothetical protein F3Y22_tig00117034pilonHSYRG01837 [Hibiscus syriacus]
MEVQYQVDGNMDPPKSSMDSSKFKRRRISAVRDYPLQFAVNLRQVDHVHPYARSPVLEKYPPPKIRKGVTVRRDFPVKLKFPTALRNQISDSKGSNSDDGMPMEYSAFDAANFCASTDSKQSNTTIAMHPESLNATIATNARDILACIKNKDDDVKEFNIHDSHECIEPKKKGVEESSLLMNIEDEQCEVDVPIADNIYACTNVRDSKPQNVPNVIDVCDIHVCTKPKKSFEETSLLMNIGDEQCQAGDYQVTHKSQNPASLTKGACSSMAGDEQCSDSMFGVHHFKETSNDDEECVEATSVEVNNPKVIFIDDEECMESTSVEINDPEVIFIDDEECVQVTSVVVNDPKAIFDDDVECVNVASVEVNHSQIGPSNEELIINNELRNDRDKIKWIINIYREVCKELERNHNGKSKGGFTMEAASILQKRHKWIKRDKLMGTIPGIEVGDHFDWRAELNLVGLHCRNIHGIDYKMLGEKIVAISVVDSGRYDNVFKSKEGEFPDTLIYLGEGENPKLKGKKPIEDQKLRGGNLALKNSAEVKNPIRVIRKFFYKYGKVEKSRYFYDGLYYVDSCREEITSSGKLVFKFLLKKFPEQPRLDWLVVWKLVCVNDIPEGKEPPTVDYVIDDISQDKERIPIRAVNDFDDEKLPIFNYTPNVTYPDSYHPVIDDGCDCIDGCSDSEVCPCTQKNGGSSYNYEERLIKKKPFIIECGPSCNCFTSCLNRVSQRGINLPLEVFKTKMKGWGVRSRSFIRCGSFICEYTGEIILDNEGEQRVGMDEYLFDIGVSDDPSLRKANSLDSSEGYECFTIDAARLGNVGRFINHSCSPNLYPQNVLYDHGNKRMPHIMFFAMEDIPPLEELTYDYNYEINGVCDTKGNIKVKPCYCGSDECNGRMY